MDSSGHDLQSVSLKHALEGVRISDLSPEERVTVLRYLLKSYISGWSGNPPGFRPYLATMEKYGWDARLRAPIKTNVRTFELTRLTHLEDVRMIGYQQIGRELRLLVSDDGTLLYEAMYYFVDDSSSGPHYRLKLCSDKQILRLMSEPKVLGWIVSNLRRGLGAKKTAAEELIARADARLQILSRLT